jgi:hypothetical protein
MGVISTQGIKFQLVAEGQILDLFKDEQVLLSDNVTGLFDLGVIPADFTRQITLPGSKKNNAFFEHVYDISVQSPDTFATNVKVPCYLDFQGIYLAQGYLQLNKVSLYQNKFIDSYEVTIYGAVSSFARQISRAYLNDLTSLAAYNHTSSVSAITSSWSGSLFNGDIVYPLAEYGQKIQYNPEEANYGIDSPYDALCVQDFKPAIKAKVVWDAIFAEAGFTYSSSFINDGGLDDIYLVCNRQLRYPLYAEVNPETYGQFRIAPISGSGATDVVLTATTDYRLPWANIITNPGGQMGSDLVFRNTYPTQLRGLINLNFQISASGAGNSVPLFTFKIKNIDTNVNTSDQRLGVINAYMDQVYQYNNPTTRTQTFNVTQQFNSDLLPSGSYAFYLMYNYSGSAANFTLTLDQGGQPKSFLDVYKATSIGDGLVMDIPLNMPYGTRGIKQIDFLTSIQKKFNLVMYPSKNRANQFIVESFNRWYDKGRRWDFDRYINLDKMIEVIPTNNFAVNELNFGDTLDQDYVSLQFSKAANREFGKSYYVDTQNFFSQGKFEVKTALASTPLLQITNTGLSGSVAGLNPTPSPSFAYQIGNQGYSTAKTACLDTYYYPTTVYADTQNPEAVTRFYYDEQLTLPFGGNYNYWKWYKDGDADYYVSFIPYSGYVYGVNTCGGV